MMPEPNSETPPAPGNPYAAPQAETADVVTTEIEPPMVVRWQYPWIGAGVAVLTKVILMAVLDTNLSSIPLYVFGNLYQAANLAIGGMGAGIVVDALRQGKFSKLMPGHWVMMIVLATFTSQLTGEIWQQIETGSLGSIRSSSWYWVTLLVDCSMMALFFLPVAWTTTEPLRWKIFAWLCLIVSLMTLIQLPLIPFLENNHFVNRIAWLGHMARTLGGPGLIVVLLLLFIIEYVFDRARVRTRDGYHWLGIYGPCVLVLILAAMAGAFS
ncbi:MULTISPECIES: hypothetical protein [Pirellulaceae]|nr:MULTISPECIES: hypothetical protein [Pirellulaceae]